MLELILFGTFAVGATVAVIAFWDDIINILKEVLRNVLKIADKIVDAGRVYLKKVGNDLVQTTIRIYYLLDGVLRERKEDTEVKNIDEIEPPELREKLRKAKAGKEVEATSEMMELLQKT